MEELVKRTFHHVEKIGIINRRIEMFTAGALAVDYGIDGSVFGIAMPPMDRR